MDLALRTVVVVFFADEVEDEDDDVLLVFIVVSRCALTRFIAADDAVVLAVAAELARGFDVDVAVLVLLIRALPA